MNWSQIVDKEMNKLRLEKASEIWRRNREFQNDVSNKSSTSSPCSWQLKKGKSADEKRKQIKITFYRNGKTIEHKYQSHQLSSQTPLPPMNMWVLIPNNFMVPDQPHLSYIPYIDDQRINSGFIDGLIDSYGEIQLTQSKESIDDDTFLDIVRSLKKYQNNDDQFVRAQASNNREALPQPIIFECLLPFFTPNTTASDLSIKYLKLTGNHQETEINVEDPTTVTTEQSLSSFHKYFCRRCCIYNCDLHGVENNPPSNMFVRHFPEMEPNKHPCCGTCYMLMDGGRFKDSINEEEDETSNDMQDDIHEEVQNTSAETGEWKASDQTMFLALYNMFPRNCCAIAKIMMSQTCQQVFKHIQLLDIKPVTATEKMSKKPKPSKKSSLKIEHITMPYKPCYHEGRCDANCSCINCEKFCNCSADCKKRVPGCHCTKNCNTNACCCYYAHRECDAATCKCHDCKNKAIQQRLHKGIDIRPSTVHGWGAFLQETCQRDELIDEYCGEIISSDEADRRGKVYDEIGRTYLFNLNKSFVIDAVRFGRKIRFVNYSAKPNCYSRINMVNGDHRIGFYANRIIKEGEELLIDYHFKNPTNPHETESDL